ncbi:MAG: response regulator transcription factor [Cyclobacteriaceae bacterium]|jgi:DNA-binding NarL/FixJ family response regulator|nr:response regulator transcription factor [Cyclobacteriaceae bacterium]
MNPIKTAVYEDDPRYRELLRTILSSSDKITPVFLTDNCQQVIGDTRKHQPDVIIMDINLPGKSGIEGVEEVKRSFPQTKVIMLTVFEDEDKIFAAIKAGADGYLLKKDSPQKVLDSIQDVFEGKSSMNGIIARKVLEYFHKKPTIKNPEEYSLTKREHEILELLMDGLTYKEIADRCSISVQTLNSHIKSIYHKLGVHSRAEASAKFRGN